jgi:predicted RNase H-like HicB family nuclease
MYEAYVRQAIEAGLRDAEAGRLIPHAEAIARVKDRITAVNPQTRPSGRGKCWVALHHTSEGYAVEALGLPGCLSQGRTEAEALANIEDAIREYLTVREQYHINADVTGVEVREVVVSVPRSTPPS